MTRYGQFCPVAKASEVFAERWTPLVLRELLAGSRRFNDICRGVPLMSRSLLAKRLGELERAGVVERRRIPGRQIDEYHLTPAGEELRPVLDGLGRWGRRWAVREVEEEDLDPAVLMWDLRRNLVEEALPVNRVVVRFDFTDVAGPRRRWWLLAGGGEADLCMTDPGFDVDLAVAVTLRGLTEYWLGSRSLRDLERAGQLRLDGPRWLQRSLPQWIGRGQFADLAPAVRK